MMSPPKQGGDSLARSQMRIDASLMKARQLASLIQSASYPRSASNIVCGSNELSRTEHSRIVLFEDGSAFTRVAACTLALSFSIEDRQDMMPGARPGMANLDGGGLLCCLQLNHALRVSASDRRPDFRKSCR
jgi:hypothetical protein